jgi:hypothetical protein
MRNRLIVGSVIMALLGLGPGASGVGAAAACGTLALNAAQIVNGYLTDQYVWSDGSCVPRSAALVRTDPKGGHAKQFTYQLADGTMRVADESPAVDPPAGGFGYIVSHLKDADIATRHGEDDSPLGSSLNQQFRSVFAGRHHAIHEFTNNYPRWGIDPATGADTKYDMPVTVHWLFATGRDHPLWSVTFDLSQAPANAVRADSRAPYGDMLFDGAPVGSWGDETGGVTWGESYRFRTTSIPFTLNSGWDWSIKNTWAPYNAIWTRTVDSEMGIAGVLINGKQEAGGYEGLDGRGFTSADVAYRCAADDHVMPCTWGWPFQSVNFAFGDPPQATITTPVKRLAWGADWGFLGQQTITTINGTVFHGWPKVSYSTFIVLGTHSSNPTWGTAEQASVVDATTLTASVGTVATQGPAGVNRTDTAAFTPVGFNPVYGTWEASVASNAATLTFMVGGGTPLNNPVLVIHGYTGTVPPSVTLNGVALVSDQDVFVSYRAETQDLWLTLNRALLGSQTVAITPGPGTAGGALARAVPTTLGGSRVKPALPVIRATSATIGRPHAGPQRAHSPTHPLRGPTRELKPAR